MRTQNQLYKMLMKILNLGFYFAALCEASQPNIVFIVADDMGWNDVSFHGSGQIPTPNIDALAYDGVILNNYYTSPICTPSRGSLMTGKYALNIGLQHYVIIANEPWGLPLKEKILPQHLKELGYITRGIGKWHLGFFEKDYLPTRRGFDSFVGSWTGYIDYYNYTHTTRFYEEMSGYDFHDGEETLRENYNNGTYETKSRTYVTELYTKMAKNIILNHDYKQPLFLYLSHQAVHSANRPLQAPSKYVNPFFYITDRNRRKFAGLLSALDISVGEVLAALDEAQVLDNTIVIFISDNGGAVKGFMNGASSNFPLRGSKFTLWEGGTRVPAWIWSKKLREKSRVSNDLMHVSDWLPTIYDIAGGNSSDLKHLDGYSQWAMISQEKSSLREEIVYNIDPIENNSAIRRRQFKLVNLTNVFDNGHFEYWFDQDGTKIPDGEHENHLNNFFQDLNESGNLQCLNSLAARILLKNYGIGVILKLSSTEKKKLIVDCQLAKENVRQNCKLIEEPCLFDLGNDPCEYNNLAKSKPEIVKELQSRLLHYQRKAIPPRNEPPDPKGNPIYHDNVYVSWRSKL